MRLLITGFEPAPGVRRTPSGELARLWAKEKLAPPSIEVRAVVLPQIFQTCIRLACTEIDAFRPDCVLMFGGVPSKDVVRVERFAVNAIHTDVGDNTMVPVHDRPILPGGPAAYETSLPFDYLLSALDEAGIHARLSYSAGTHTCNNIMYGVRHYLCTTGRSALPAGFIHVPFPREFAAGVIEDEVGLMSWAEVRRASVVVAEAMGRFLEPHTKEPDRPLEGAPDTGEAM